MPDPGYYAVHTRLAAERGPASAHDCTCGRAATGWAYTGPREASERYPWSEDLSLYKPMCGRCHSRFDRSAVKAQDRHPNDAALF